MAREYGPTPADPPTKVIKNVTCWQCKESYDAIVTESYEGSLTVWTWTCPEPCGYENEELADILYFEDDYPYYDAEGGDE